MVGHHAPPLPSAEPDAEQDHFDHTVDMEAGASAPLLEPVYTITPEQQAVTMPVYATTVPEAPLYTTVAPGAAPQQPQLLLVEPEEKSSGCSTVCIVLIICVSVLGLGGIVALIVHLAKADQQSHSAQTLPPAHPTGTTILGPASFRQIFRSPENNKFR